MANVPTAEQTVFPEQGGLPNANPAAFGAPVARAEGQIGQGLGQTGDVFAQRALAIQGLKNEATANNADVAFQNDLGQLETQYYGLEGKAAADAQPKFQQDVTALRQKYLGTMTNPEAAEMLDKSLSYSVARSMYSAGRYAGAQSRQWVINSSDARADMLVAQIGSHYTDSDYYNTATAAIKQSAVDIGQIKGWTQDQIDLYANDKIQKAEILRQNNAKAYLDGLPVNERAAALLGGETAPQGVVGGQEYHTTTAAIEQGIDANGKAITNASGHTGLFQASQDWWKQFGGGGDINKEEDQHKALDRETEFNEPKLQAALGRNPTNADLYLAHQQGLQGAIRLLENPNAKATDIAGEDAIKGNIPNDPQTGQPVLDYHTATAAQFSALWAKPYTDAGMAPTIASAPMGANSPAAIAQLLPADVRMKMTKDTLDAWYAQDAAYREDVRFKQEQDVKAQKVEYDSQVNSAKDQISANWAEPQKNPPLDIGKFSQTPFGQAHPEAVTELINYRKNLTNTPDDVTDKQTTAALYRGYLNGTTGVKDFQEAFAPADGTPGKISKANLDFLMGTAKSGGDSVADANTKALKDGFIKNNDYKILHDQGVDQTSPLAHDAEYRFLTDFNNSWEAKVKAGEDPRGLITPGNKDYFGSPGNMSNYVKTAEQWYDEEQKAQAAANPQQPGLLSRAWDAVFGGNKEAAGPAVPPELPKGSTYAGKLKDGRDAYRLPDGSLRAAKPPEATPPAPVADASQTVPLGP